MLNRLWASRQILRDLHLKHEKLLEDVAFYFECEDAMRTVRGRLCLGTATLSTYKELSVWAGAVESYLRGLTGGAK